MLNKIALICCLIGFVLGAECVGGDCLKKQDDKNVKFGDITPKIDIEIRANFWYYLKEAKLSIQVSFDSDKNYAFSFIYENFIGTFLCYVIYEKGTDKIYIQSFLRIGNGVNNQNNPFLKMINPEPFLISIRLKENQYLVQNGNNGQLKIKGKNSNLKNNEEISTQSMKMKERMTENYIRRRYSKFLKDGEKSNQNIVMTTQKSFIALTFTTVLGRFLAVCTCDNSLKVQIEVFLRLEDNIEDQSQDKEHMKAMIMEIN